MWINVPSTTSAFVPEAQDSTWDCNSLSEAFAQSVVWNTKPQSSKSWLRRWKRVAWMKRLFGRTCDPSMAKRGVESWIRSLLDTRASRSAKPADAADQMILGTFGLTSIASLAKLNPASSFSKTCPATSASDSKRSSKPFKEWITGLRQDCGQRQRLAQAKGGNGFSFSRWPTPTARDYRTPNSAYSQQHRKRDGCKSQQLNNFVAHYFRPAPKVPIGTEKQTTYLPRLNPAFVCWLMGWPEIVPIGSDFSETAWCLFRRRMRSALCALLLSANETQKLSEADKMNKRIKGSLGDQIRSARRAAGLTQTELARRAGLFQPHVAALESGATPALNTLRRLADALGATWGYDGKRIYFRGPTTGRRKPRRPAAGK